MSPTPWSHIPHGLNLNKLSLSTRSSLHVHASAPGLTPAAVWTVVLHLGRVVTVKPKNSVKKIQAKRCGLLNNLTTAFINSILYFSHKKLSFLKLIFFKVPDVNHFCRIRQLNFSI